MKATKVFLLELEPYERAMFAAAGEPEADAALAKADAGQPLTARECEQLREALVRSGQARGAHKVQDGTPCGSWQQSDRADGGRPAAWLEETLWSLVR